MQTTEVFIQLGLQNGNFDFTIELKNTNAKFRVPKLK